MIPFVVEEIRRLSQEEGLNDGEIAERLGLSRATVNRARQANGIPRANLQERMDKKYVCNRCGNTVTIKRKERRQKYCPACKPIVAAENMARKLERMRAKNEAE